MIEALTVINETFDGVLGKIPCYNTIGNWIKKYGLDVYNSSGQSLKDKDFAELTDESMMIGSENCFDPWNSLPASRTGSLS